MNTDTPTPRTDAFTKSAYDTDIDDYAAYNKAVTLARQLERELITTQQAHDVVVLAFRKIDTELTAVTEQRDRLVVIMQKLEYQRKLKYPRNNDAPGHCHDVPSKWDLDGSDCEWCKAWDDLRNTLQSLNQPNE